MLDRSFCPDEAFSAADPTSGRAGCAELARALDEQPVLSERLARVPRVFFYWLAALYAVWVVRATWLFDGVDAHIGPLPRAIEAHALALFVWAVPALWVARLVFGPRFADAIRLGMPKSLDGERWRARGVWRTWAFSLLAMFFWFSAFLVFEHATAARHVSFDGASLARLTASLSLAPVAEEIVFRGLILSVLERRLCLYRSNMITSLLFVAAQLPMWVHAAAGRPGAIDEIALRCSMQVGLSLFLGALTLRTRSIGPAVVAHLVNNALVAMLA